MMNNVERDKKCWISITIWFLSSLPYLYWVWTNPFYCLLMCQNSAGWVTNCLDLAQTQHFVASEQGLHCLLRLLVWVYMGWSGGAKVLCILHHWGVQLILAYSWARPAILVVGKGRGGMFLFASVSSLSFLFLFLPCPSLSSPLLSLLSLFSLSLGDDAKWPSRVDVSLNPNTIKSGSTLFAQAYLSEYLV